MITYVAAIARARFSNTRSHILAIMNSDSARAGRWNFFFCHVFFRVHFSFTSFDNYQSYQIGVWGACEYTRMVEMFYHLKSGCLGYKQNSIAEKFVKYFYVILYTVHNDLVPHHYCTFLIGRLVLCPPASRKLEVGLKLRETKLCNGMLYSTEAWSKISNKEIDRMETVDAAALRAIVGGGHSKCPKVFYYLEFGILMFRHVMMIKRIGYHHHILTRDDKEIIKKSLLETKRNTHKRGLD